MESSGESDHAFIIRIWKENREVEGASPTWRGVIEHVRSEEKRYLVDFSGVAAFIIPYLQAMGVDTKALHHWTAEYQKPEGSSPKSANLMTNQS